MVVRLRAGREKLARVGGRARRLAYDVSIRKPVVLEDAYGIRFIRYPDDTRTPHDLVAREFERTEFEAIRRLVRSGSVVLDVGANVGIFSVWLRRCAGPDSTVHAFEPVPTTHRRLRETLALNGLDDLRTHPLAITNVDGPVTMHVFDDAHSAWSSLGTPSFDGVVATATLEVEGRTLDTFAVQHAIERIDFLKIDVEGFELHALQGAARLLGAGAIDVLSFEVSAIALAASGVRPREVFALLADAGYRAYEPTPDGFAGPVDDSTAYYANYYASRRNLASRRPL
jgi:FkbM family methyltransferase